MRVLIVVLLAAFFVLPEAYAGNEGGNGGGGIQRNGTYLTFGSAQLHVGLEPLDEVPGLKLLEKTVLRLKVGPLQKAALLNVITIDGRRNYFKINSSDLDQVKKEAFLKAYQKAISAPMPIENLVIFAVTSKNAAETYLMPEFFQLKPLEQTAILFHEALWLLMPESTSYNFVIDAEIKFQKFLERGVKGYDPKFYPVLDEVFRDHVLSLKVALKEDFESGVFAKDLVAINDDPSSKKTCLPLEKLVGAASVRKEGFLGRNSHSEYRNIYLQFVADLLERMKKYPRSKGLRRLYEVRERIQFGGMYYENSGSGTGWMTYPIEIDPEGTFVIDLSTIDTSPPKGIPMPVKYGPMTGIVRDASLIDLTDHKD